MQLPSVRDGMRVCGNHPGAEPAKQNGDIQRRGVADVIRVRLERQAQHSHFFAENRTAEGVDGQVDRALAPTEIDGIHFLEESNGFPASEFFCSGGECPDVFGQAASAETDTGTEEAPADPGIESDGVCQLGDVGSGHLGDLCHGVDE